MPGFIKKEAQFCEKNRGQTSNLYTLVQLPKKVQEIDEDSERTSAVELQRAQAQHITFADIMVCQTEPKTITEEIVVREPAGRPEKKSKNCIYFLIHLSFEWCRCDILRLLSEARSIGQFSSCAFLLRYWTGVGFSFPPP